MPEEIFTRQLKVGRRTYFFDVKQSSTEEMYLKITESKQIGADNFERHQILVFQEDAEKFEKAILDALIRVKPKAKTSSLDEKRKKYPNAYQPWTDEDDRQLEQLYCEGKRIKELAQFFGRNSGAINSRIKKLELNEKYGSR